MHKDTRFLITYSDSDHITTEAEVVQDMIGWGFETADGAKSAIVADGSKLWEVTVTVKEVKL
jgi:hypothetical protein